MTEDRLEQRMTEHLEALRRNCSIHYERCERSEAWHTLMNVAIIVASTVLLAFTFHVWAPPWDGVVRYASAGASILIAAAGSYQAFARPSERAARHKTAAIRYGVLAKRLEVWISGGDATPAEAFYAALLNDWEEISSQAPLTRWRHRGRRPTATPLPVSQPTNNQPS